MCTPCDAARCHAGVPPGSAGGTWVARQSTRTTASANTVTPIHLCHEKYFSLVGVKPGMSVITQPSAKPQTISSAISQCSAIAVCA